MRLIELLHSTEGYGASLREARQGLLYYWVDLSKLRMLFTEDSFKGEWTHRDPLTKRVMIGTSMSRNPMFKHVHRSARLVFDEAKLAQRFKIIPLDADYVYTYGVDPKYYGGPAKDLLDQARTKISRVYEPEFQYAEEFVLGNIPQTHRYLVAIDIDPESLRYEEGGTSTYIELAREYSRRYGIPLRLRPTHEFIKDAPAQRRPVPPVVARAAESISEVVDLGHLYLTKKEPEFPSEKSVGLRGLRTTTYDVGPPGTVTKRVWIPDAFHPVLAFLRTIRRHPDNPFFPRVFHAKLYRVPGKKRILLVVQMERLHELDDKHLIDALPHIMRQIGVDLPEERYQNQIGYVVDIANLFSTSKGRAKLKRASKSPQFVEAMNVLESDLQHYGSDLHGANFMLRLTGHGPQLVIIDPFIPPDTGWKGEESAHRSSKGALSEAKFRKPAKRKLTEFVDVNSPSFREWFGKSKVVDEDGKPMLVYHGTADPKEFRSVRGLSHFGTLGAATSFVGPRDIRQGPHRIYPVYLRIENPVGMADSGQSHNAFHLAGDIAFHVGKLGDTHLKDALDALIHKWINTYGGSKTLSTHTPGEHVPGEHVRMLKLIRLLQKFGYDGIGYYNRSEHPGSFSWVPFSRKQIRYAYAESGLSEAKFRKPIEMYHGTTSKFLRSILKQGVVPYPKEKKWSEDPFLSSYDLSRVSLEGSYWTSNLMTAISSATNATGKFGGSSIVVIGMISEGAAFADEDDTTRIILNAVPQTYQKIFGRGVVADAAAKLLAGIYWGSKDQDAHIRWQARSMGKELPADVRLQDLIADTYTNLVHEQLSINPSKQPVDRGLIRQILEDLLERAIAFEKHSSSWGNAHVTDYEAKAEKGLAPPLRNIQDLEDELLGLREKLTRVYRKTAYFNPEAYNHTLRTTHPVTFRGANRVIAIVGEGAHYRDPLILYYGKLTQEYLRQYHERIGTFPGAVNPQGEMVMQPEER